MSFPPSTKEMLLETLNDMEIISKDLIDSMIVPKQYKLSANDHQNLVDLFISKHNEFRNLLKVAAEQQKLHLRMNTIKEVIRKQDVECMKMYEVLKLAEKHMAECIFQSRFVLNNGPKTPLNVDEIIKYAMRISCSYGTNAPDDWKPSDLQRPYPRDMDMRAGFLGMIDLGINISSPIATTSAAAAAAMAATSSSSVAATQGSSEASTSESTQTSASTNKPDLPTSVETSNSTTPVETQSQKETAQDEVEVMSSDSSNSSSSSDSQ